MINNVFQSNSVRACRIKLETDRLYLMNNTWQNISFYISFDVPLTSLPLLNEVRTFFTHIFKDGHYFENKYPVFMNL